MKYQAFFIIFKGLALKHIYIYIYIYRYIYIYSIYLEDKIPTLNSHFTILKTIQKHEKFNG